MNNCPTKALTVYIAASTVNSGYLEHLAIKRTLFIKRMLSSSHKLLYIKRMRLIGVAFYEPDLDRLESMWSPDIFGEMMAISCKKIEFQTNRQHLSS